MGEKYFGVGALFNGDLQTVIGNADREDWVVVSKDEIEYTGLSSAEYIKMEKAEADSIAQQLPGFEDL